VLGQAFQYMFNSHTVGGVGKDAAYVVAQLARTPASGPEHVGSEGPRISAGLTD
jgi:hypothetical protein